MLRRAKHVKLVAALMLVSATDAWGKVDVDKLGDLAEICEKAEKATWGIGVDSQGKRVPSQRAQVARDGTE